VTKMRAELRDQEDEIARLLDAKGIPLPAAPSRALPPAPSAPSAGGRAEGDVDAPRAGASPSARRVARAAGGGAGGAGRRARGGDTHDDERTRRGLEHDETRARA
jgi:hypothetical protein